MSNFEIIGKLDAADVTMYRKAMVDKDMVEGGTVTDTTEARGYMMDYYSTVAYLETKYELDSSKMWMITPTGGHILAAMETL